MGSSNTPMDAHPRHGFSPLTPFDGSLTNATLVTAAIPRVAGLRYVVVPGIFTLVAGAGSVQLFLEGSNDAVNWVVCAQSGPTELFTTNGQEEILNSEGSGQADLEHFAYLRVRAAIVAGAPTFSLRVIVSGISRDSEKFLKTDTYVRSGATPTVQNGLTNVRPAGTRMVNAQLVASGVVLGGATSFDVVLQGSPDGGTTWFDIASASVTANGSQLLLADGERFVSLGSYSRFRTIVQDVGVAGALAAFSISVYTSLDSVDWIADSEGSGGSFDSNEVFIEAVFGPPSAEVADVITIGLQLYDAEGAVLLESRKVEFILYDTSDAGDLDLASTAVFNVLTSGTVIAGLATNRLVLTTTAGGQASVDVLDAAVETTYLTAVNPRANLGTPQYIAQASQATLVFA